jgi:hypothetical protein
VSNVDFIIQEYVDLPVEISIMCHKIPGANEGHITSVCLKEFLTVTGNGKATILEIIMLNPRAILQADALKSKYGDVLNQIPSEGKEVKLEPIGNHCRGTKFINGNYLIDQQLTDQMIKILDKMDGVNYGRFDLRTESLESLKNGKSIRVLEFNGAAGEPAHVYDPTYSLWNTYRDFWKQWDIMYRISKVQISKGFQPIGIRKAWSSLMQYWKYIRKAKVKTAS